LSLGANILKQRQKKEKNYYLYSFFFFSLILLYHNVVFSCKLNRTVIITIVAEFFSRLCHFSEIVLCSFLLFSSKKKSRENTKQVR
jgi:hypothetical protein